MQKEALTIELREGLLVIYQTCSSSKVFAARLS
jgi:hypothetical protein